MLTLWRSLGRPARNRFLLALLLSAIAGASSVALLGLSGWFLTAAAIAGASGGGYVFNHLYPSAGVRGAAFTRVMARYGEQLLGHDATLRLSARLRPDLFASSAASQRGFTSLPASELSVLIDDVDAAEAGFLRVFGPAVAVLAGAGVALGFVFAADALTGVIALAALLCSGWVLPALAVKRSRRQAAELSGRAEAAREQTARLIENAVELEIIGALGRQAAATRETLSHQLAAQDAIEAPFRNLSAFTSTAGLALALMVVWRSADSQDGIAMATGAALALMAAFDATGAMLKVFDAKARSEIAAARLAGRLARREAAWDPPLETAQRIDSIFPLEASGLLAQAAPNAPLIGPVAFTIQPGMLVQVIGASGKGKTTLAETLMRLQPVAGGSLSYSGMSGDRVRIANVLEHIAISPQFPAFLPGTLADQLRLAAPDAGDEALWSALQTACADQPVRDKATGLGTLFEDGNPPFSGGELRRIGLARALLANPDLLILDEPFAGLEPALAQRLAASLAAWAKAGPRSLVLLAHKEIAEPSEGLRPLTVRL